MLRAIWLKGLPWIYSQETAMMSVILVALWKEIGYYMVMFLAGLQSIPATYYEAAEIDGATAMQTFYFLTLPLLKPTILFIVITSLISYFQTYIPVMVLTQGGPGTKTYLASYIIYNQAFVKYNFGYASAISFVLFLIIALLTFASFRLGGQQNIGGAEK